MPSKIKTNESVRNTINKISKKQRDGLLEKGWWHSIDFGNGFVTPGVHTLKELQSNYARFQLPDNLRGKRVLDCGCWDGFYAFEAERHGAEVVAIDCWKPENFFLARSALKSQVEFYEKSVYELTRKQIGAFDIVLFLGVLYHLRHPLLALERICELTREAAVIESHVIDNILPADNPIMEFYELDELGGQYDNWWGPNRLCLERMTRSAGFARTELVRNEPTRAVIKAYRRWDNDRLSPSTSMKITTIVNAVNGAKYFPNRGRQAYISILVRDLPACSTRDNVKVEVDQYGVSPIFVGSSDNSDKDIKQINAPIPPGVDIGMRRVRVMDKQQKFAEANINLVDGSEW